jgi:hypothetical protein
MNATAIDTKLKYIVDDAVSSAIIGCYAVWLIETLAMLVH